MPIITGVRYIPPDRRKPPPGKKRGEARSDCHPFGVVSDAKIRYYVCVSRMEKNAATDCLGFSRQGTGVDDRPIEGTGLAAAGVVSANASHIGHTR